MNSNTFAVGLLLVAGLLFVNSNDTPPVQSAVTPQTTAKFDYGDGVAEATTNTLPVEPFTATPPTSNTAVGSMPVIDGQESLTKVDVSAFSDVPGPSNAQKLPVASQSPIDTDWVQHVVPVSTRDTAGSAVAVLPDTLVTVYHVAKYANADVVINGQRVTGSVTKIPQADEGFRDASIIRIAEKRLPTMRVRAPVYYEPVTLYGLATKVKQRGFVSAARYVSLLPDAPGVSSGDSGGAVVADDGCLVGLISGNESAQAGISANKRVVGITRGDYFLPYLQRQQFSGVNGSTNTQTQPSAFDPQPGVTSGPSCAAPAVSAYTQQFSQPSTVYYVPRQQLRKQRRSVFFWQPTR